jgi:hypothetical protein
MAGAYRYSYDDVGGGMIQDEALNGMGAGPAYYGGLAAAPGVALGMPGATAAAAAPAATSALGSASLLLWGGLLVLLVLSHTLSLEVQQ